MKEFDKLVETIRILRAPGGCPWDRAQKIENYKKYLLEETYELFEEIDRKRIRAVEEELGDLFLILVVIAEMFREKGKISLESILEKVDAKLIHRHPHVFADKKLNTKEEVLAYWIKHKAKKKRRKTIKDRLPRTAPALFLADLFLKEYTHKQKNTPKSLAKKTDNLSANIAKRLKLLSRNKNKAKTLSEINFLLCQIASLYHLDLEDFLRRLVLKKAGKISY